MQNAAVDGASAESRDRNDNYRAIVSEIVSLIKHVNASKKLIEAAISAEMSPGDQEVAASVVVLDDVTPRYIQANAALNACNASLGPALHVLLDSTTSIHRPDRSADCGCRPFRLIGHT